LILTARRNFPARLASLRAGFFSTGTKTHAESGLAAWGETMFSLFYKTAVSTSEFGVKAKPCDSPKFQSSQLVPPVNVTT